MNNTCNFTIIISYKNTEMHIEETILSITEQKLSFKANVQLILLNNNSKDNSTLIARHFQRTYPKNISIINESNINKSKNIALKQAKGKYIAFINSNDYLSKEVLANVLTQFKQNPECNIVKVPFNEIGVNQEIKEQLGQTIINLEKTNNIPTTLESLFIKKELLQNQQYDETQTDSENLQLINNIFTTNKTINIAEGTYNKRLTNQTIKTKQQYENKITTYKQLLKTENNNPNYVQNLILKDLNKTITVPHIHLFKTTEEKESYVNSIQEILQEIDTQKILKQKFTKNIKKLLIHLKENKEQKTTQNNLQLYEIFNNYYLERNEIKFTIILETIETPKYLEESIKSIINQTIPFKENIQIIIINNNTNNETTSISEHYQKIYPQNIRIITEDSQNAKNNAIQQAKGTYISFLNESDYYSWNVMENVYNAFKENPQTNIIKIGYKEVGIKEQNTGQENTIININNIINKDYSYKTLFIKKDTLTQYNFNQDKHDTENLYILADLIQNNPEIFLTKGWYNHRTINTLKTEHHFQKIKVCQELLNKTNNNYTQNLVISVIDELFTTEYIENLDDNNEKKDIITTIQEITKHLTKEQIINHQYTNNKTKRLLIYLKEQISENTTNLEVYNIINTIFLKENEIDYYQSGSFNFSIIIQYSNSERLIEKTITSITEDQTLPFKQNTQLIFINNQSTDNSTTIIKHYQNQYPENISIINESNINKAKNRALKYATGKYIAIINGTDYISPHTLENVLEMFPENNEINIIKMPVKHIGLHNIKDPILQEDSIVDLREHPSKTQTYESLFIKNKIIKQEQFDETQTDIDNIELLNKIILENPVLGIAKGQYYQRVTYDNLRIQNQNQSTKEHYQNKIKTYQKIIKESTNNENKINDYTQYMISDDLEQLISKAHLHLFETEQEKTEYLNNLENIIQQLDENKIINQKHTYTNIKRLQKSYNKKKNYEEDNLTINNITEKDNNIYIKGNYTSIRNNKHIPINIILNEKTEIPCNIIKTENTNYDPVTLADEIEFTDHFETTIPKNNTTKFEFQITENNTQYTPQIKLQENKKTKNSVNINKELIAYNNTRDIILQETKKDKHYTFSIIIAVYNTERFIEESINSIINQTLSFKENTEIIIVDDGSTDNSINIIKGYKEQYPENITIIEKTHSGQASARDLGLKIATGQYVNFLDSDDYLEKDTLEKVKEYIDTINNKTDVITIPMNYVDRLEKEHPLNYKYDQTRIINLEEEYENPQLSLSSAFINTETIQKYEFDTSLISSEDTLILNKVLLEKRTMGVLNNTHYNYRLRFSEDNLTESLTTDKQYYTHRLEHFHKHLLNYCLEEYDEIPLFIQYMIATDLNKLFSIRKLDVFEDKDEIDEFWEYIKSNDGKYDILTHISDECIKNNNNIKQPLKSLMMYHKNREYKVSVSKNGIVKLSTKNHTIDTLNNHGLWFDIIEVRFNKLNLSGHFVSNFYPETITLKIIKTNENGREQAYPCEYFEYATEDRSHLESLSFPWRYDYNFNVQVPLDNVSIADFRFELTYKENGKTITITPTIGFRVPSGLTEFNKYFVQESRIVFYQDKKIYVYPYSYKMMLKREFRTLQLITQDKQDGYKKIIFYRILYMLLYPFMKNKRIWFINDRLDRADENGIHLFKYAYQQNDGIKKYYILDKHCDDYKKLKKRYGGSILAHNSFKHKLLYFFTEKRIASFLNEAFFNPFWIDGNYDIRKIYCNLVTSPWYFLQHGIIYRDLTSHIKRYKYNLALVVTSTERERQSFFDLKYGFPEEVVQILGLPRYDNLIKDNEVKKQILFTPTWRLQLEKDESLFLNSDYYHMLNSFLSNDELFKLLDEYGYKFIFKPHPQLIKHLDSFEMNDAVIVSTEESYQELIRDSALMISDVSSVISDFAYLKKPIIYYQKNDDHHFEPFFDYVSEGFGDVFKTEEDVIDKVRFYLENGCVMEDKYKERVSNFFKYNDKNNCKRVYEWILKH
ncbi:MAG: glycosyltransferase [Methanosphaera sp.]|nr:glycosyltransferase [Methanosphaera sp.]